MHVRLHLVPFHGVPRAVGAENRIGGVLHVRLGVVTRGGDHGFCVMTGGVAPEGKSQPTRPAREGTQGLGIVAEGRHGRRAAHDGAVPKLFGRLCGPPGALHVRQHAAHQSGGDLDRERVGRLQQQAFGLHQSLPHSAVGGLPEVAALRMLFVGAAGGKDDLHVRNGAAGQHAHVRALIQVRQDQTLPVQVQLVRAAVGAKAQSRAALQRL